MDIDASPGSGLSFVSNEFCTPSIDVQAVVTVPTRIDLTNAFTVEDTDPLEEISRTTNKIFEIMELNLDPDEILQMVTNMLDKLKCIPLYPVFPPPTQDYWSNVIQLADDHDIDEDWLHQRMKNWISYIAQVPVVPLEKLAVTIRATRSLLVVVDPQLRTERGPELEARIIIWWTNLVQLGASREKYNEAWCLLGEFVDSQEIAAEHADKVEMHWKEVFRLRPLDDDR